MEVLTLKPTLGVRLRELREAKNLSQKEAASRFGITNFQLSRYETGKANPDPDLIAKFAEFYEVSSDYLLGLSDIRNPEKQPEGEMFFWDLENTTPEEIEEAKRYIEFRRQQLNKRKHEDS
ncbi:XRE family transcriptional regulator [Sporolactobacillus sp. THM7-7]|nr:XRE family transcriptional regulator [Sporolactobacillus sp. THM7-7]